MLIRSALVLVSFGLSSIIGCSQRTGPVADTASSPQAAAPPETAKGASPAAISETPGVSKPTPAVSDAAPVPAPKAAGAATMPFLGVPRLALTIMRNAPAAFATLSIPAVEKTPVVPVPSVPEPSAPVPSSVLQLVAKRPAVVGAPVVLSTESLTVKVTVRGRLARTETTQVFRNHTDRQTEGTYDLRLPEGAAISRLAMDVDGKLVEGELVEREQARSIYESIVRQQKDPALLEWQGGNRFTTHVFPIPALGTKTVVVAWEELLPAADSVLRYRYALPEAPTGEVATAQVGRFQFTLESDLRASGVSGYGASIEGDVGAFRVTASQERLAPEGPLDVTFDAASLPRSTVVERKDPKTGTIEHLFLVDHVFPGLTAEPRAPKAVVVAIDTSAGIGSVELAHAVGLVKGLAAALPAGTELRIVHGSLTATACEAGIACLDGLEALGATDLGALLGKAAEVASTLVGRVAVVVLSDGVATTGELDSDLLRARLVSGISGKDISVHCVAIGASPNVDDLRSLARVGRGHAMAFVPEDDAALAGKIVASAVAEPVITDVKVTVVAGEVDGLVPAETVSIAPLERLPVLGRLASETATISITGKLGDVPVSARWDIKRAGAAPDALLPRFWARSALAEMERGHVKREAVVATSLGYGVMSRYTSFLVLENEAAYERFQIERTKKAELEQAELAKAAADSSTAQAAPQGLTKGKESLQEKLATETTVTSMDKKAEEESPEKPSPSEPPMHANAPRAKRAMQDSDGISDQLQRVMGGDGEGFVVGHGLSGTGSGGGGQGIGRIHGLGGVAEGKRSEFGIGRAPGEPGPRLSVGNPQTSGALSQDVIKNVVKRNSGGIRSCYETALRQNPDLEGKLVVDFTVGPAGAVVKSKARGFAGTSSLLACAEKRVATWRFPKPEGGGVVIISYPFVLQRGSGLGPAPEQLIAELEKAKDLTPDDFMRLFGLYAQLEDAKAASQRWKKLRAGNELEGGLLCALGISFRTLLPDEALDIEAVCTKALAEAGADPELFASMAEFLAAQRRPVEFEALFGKTLPQEGQAPRILSAALDVSPDPAFARRLLDGWVKLGSWSARTRWNVLAGAARGWELLPEDVVATTRAVLADNPDLEVIEQLAGAAWMAERGTEIIEFLRAACLRDDSDLPRCQRILAGRPVSPEVDLFKKALAERELTWIVHVRKEDIGNGDLIRRHATLLRVHGDARRADLVLSEMVEFASTDFAARSSYSQALEAEGQISESCAQLALAVQLAPAERDTFRTMMELRRRHQDEAKTVRSCIVEGVSKLPVQRSLSLVLTWEDPSADVDMHVVDPSGEEVYFSHRESAAGGFLYYDITNGLGPEVYTLGTAPKGAYKLGVVYYSGGGQNITGTLTILRNAGAPDETREDRPFTLKAPDTNFTLKLGTVDL